MEVHNWHWLPNAKPSWVVESKTVANIKKLGHLGGREESGETENWGRGEDGGGSLIVMPSTGSVLSPPPSPTQSATWPPCPAAHTAQIQKLNLKTWIVWGSQLALFYIYISMKEPLQLKISPSSTICLIPLRQLSQERTKQQSPASWEEGTNPEKDLELTMLGKRSR